MQINIKKRGEGFQIYADFEFEVLIRKKHKIGNDYFPDWRFSDSWLHVRGDGISYFSGNSYYLENSNQHELGIIPHGIEFKLTDSCAFLAIVASLNDPAYAQQSVPSDQGIKCAARTDIPAKPASRDQQVKQQGAEKNC